MLLPHDALSSYVLVIFTTCQKPYLSGFFEIYDELAFLRREHELVVPGTWGTTSTGSSSRLRVPGTTWTENLQDSL